jgi:hypothetical protein
MRLGLSSAAAPGASPAELMEVCARRGLAVLELTADAAESAQGPSSPAAAVELCGVLADATHGADRLAGLSRRAGAPVIVAGAADPQARLACAR